MNVEINKRIPYLDGLRGIAILLVLIGHGINTLQNKAQYVYLDKSHLGVMIFFVISGFLITKLLIIEKEKKGNVDLTNFYFRRSLRIFPVFYTYIICIVLLVILNVLSINFSNILIASVYLQNNTFWFKLPPSGPDIWYIGHFWTLALEEQFYLLWPLIFYWFDLKKITRILPYILMFIFPMFRLAIYLLYPEIRGHDGYMLHSKGDIMLWGAYFALSFKYCSFNLMSIIENKINKYSIIFFILFLFIGNDLLKNQFQGIYSFLFQNTLEGCSIGIILVYLLLKEPINFRFLNNIALVYIGTLSYSLYIWQQLFLAKPECSLTFSFPVNFILTFIVAWISYNTIEKIGLKIKKRFA